MSKEHVKEIFQEAVEKDAKYIFTEMYIQGYPHSEIIVNPIENLPLKLDYILEKYDDELKMGPVQILSYGYCHEMGQLDYLKHAENKELN